MSPKIIIILTITANLIVGNFILLYFEFSRLLTSFISGHETTGTQILLHLLCSIISTSCIYLLSIYMRKKRRFSLLIILFSFTFSALVPFLSTYVLFFGYAIVLGEPDLVKPAFFSATIATLQSVTFWVPFALFNSSMLVVYNYRQNPGHQRTNH